ncbi:unnamed protein product [Owenia fusiformis]|uniref:Uncharacterized protein n=1 Tax=Owenia fusiformis TaxID=6347 RepID=A0A8S4PEJ2_OWEFU|nr:unnamed protein product [Owenia fusiformis]
MPKQMSRQACEAIEDLHAPTLRKKRTELGIKAPLMFSKATLLKLYKQNKGNGNDVSNRASDVTEELMAHLYPILMMKRLISQHWGVHRPRALLKTKGNYCLRL